MLNEPVPDFSQYDTAHLSAAVRRLGRGWFVVIGLVCALLLSGQLVMDGCLSSKNGNAKLINIAGSQRCLSQRVASKVAAVIEAKTEHDTAQELALADALGRTLDEFVRWHTALVHRDGLEGLPGVNSNEVAQLFAQLDPYYNQLVRIGRSVQSICGKVSDDSSWHKGVVEIETASDEFLPIMDQIVDVHQAESEARLARVQTIGRVITLVTFVVFLATGAFIVLPMTRRSVLAAKQAAKTLRIAQRASYEADRLAAFARLSTNGMVRADAEQRVVWVNEGFERIFGLGIAECRGRPMLAVLQGEQADSEPGASPQQTVAVGAGVRRRTECRIGSRVSWIDLEIVPEHDHFGSVSGFIAIQTDVTDIVVAEQAAEDRAKVAELASRAKTDFLANMSHEIRTPMTAILGYADLLDEAIGSDPDLVVDAIKTIRSNADLLLTVINDILDVSKIEAGQMGVERIDTSPVRIVEDVVSLVRPRAHGQGIELFVSYESPVPECIQSDPVRLRQILLNLVGNAIKFTEAGSVTIRTRFDRSANQLCFGVEDTGIGMTPEQVCVISRFEAFSQADSSTTRKYGGTGLGLRISNSFIGLLGGSLQVESVFGQGSTFTAKIDSGDTAGVAMLRPGGDTPAAANGEPAWDRRKERAMPGGGPLAGVRVLLAEDAADNRRLLVFHLQRAGAEVVVCENGLLAAEAIETSSVACMPHIVLMDMQMPTLDGYRATRRLRRGGYTLPIVAITAHAMDGDREKCVSAGCDAYCTKPIDPAALIRLCAAHVELSPADRRAA